jgi:hypothetical protein
LPCVKRNNQPISELKITVVQPPVRRRARKQAVDR